MLNLRLEAVRRRFAELEPSVLGALLEDEEVPGTASTMADHPSSAASNLSRSRSTISMIPAPPPPASDSSRTSEDGSPSAREQLGGVGGAGGPGAADASGAGPAEVIAAGGALGKATQWFKKSFASKKKASARSGSAGSLGAASSSSSIVSGKSLPGISEAAEDDEDQPYPISPIRERPYPTTPLFTPLPTVHEPYGSGAGTDLLSPARSSFESAASPNSPAESFFSEKQEDALVSADVYRQQRNTGLALPPRTASTSSSSDQSHGSSLSTGDGLSAFSPQQQSLSVPSSSTTASPGGQSGVFSFEFATSPVSDSFEVPVSSSIAHPSLTFTPSGTSPLDPLLPIHSSAHHPPPSPTNPTTSMRMSRSFSRRSSLLTPLAQNVLESLAEGKPLPPTSPIRGRKEQGYDKSRHCYAHRFFAEMEDTLQEYQEWYAVGTGPGGVEGGDGAPPRLTVGWSFNDDE